MKKGIRFRFWLEIGMAVLTSVLSVVTLIWSHWVEMVFGVSLDGGNGMFELLLVVGLFIVTIILFVMARFEWRKFQIATGDLSQ